MDWLGYESTYSTAIRVHDIEKKYYADGEDAYAMRLTLKEPKKKQPIRGVVEEVNQVAATAAAK